MSELYNKLQCKSLYYTGSTANKCIKHPNDTEYYAVYGSLEELKNAPVVRNVIKITEDFIPKKWFVWHYLHIILNKSEPLDGEKIHFAEPSIEKLQEIVSSIERCNHNAKLKYFYHCAMVKAIAKYGYDNIPEEVANLISDLHDYKITYKQFEDQFNSL